MTTMFTQLESLPEIVREIFEPLDEAVRAALDEKLCRSLQRVYITGAGDSHFAALSSELAFEQLGGIAAEPITALRFALLGRVPAANRPEHQPGDRYLRIWFGGAHCGSAEHGSAVWRKHPFLRNLPGQLRLAFAPIYQPTGADADGFAYRRSARYWMNGKRKRCEPSCDSAPAAERTLLSSMLAARTLAEDWDNAGSFVFVGGGPNYGKAYLRLPTSAVDSGCTVCRLPGRNLRRKLLAALHLAPLPGSQHPIVQPLKTALLAEWDEGRMRGFYAGGKRLKR